MSNPDIIRAWKDAQYRQSLSAEELASLPAHPAGSVELSDAELASIDGGVIGTVATVCTATAAVATCTAAVTCNFTSDIALCINTTAGLTIPCAVVCPVME